MKRIILLISLTLAVSGLTVAQTTKSTKYTRHRSRAAAKKPDHALFKPGDIKWVDAPNSLPPGAKVAVLEGDPTKPGIFTMRLSFPDGYKISPHYHTQWEHVTVISGQLNLGLGSKVDQLKGNAMPAGTFGFMAPGMKHFAWVTGYTVIQLHGIGPWEIIYVNPKDDPRKQM